MEDPVAAVPLYVDALVPTSYYQEVWLPDVQAACCLRESDTHVSCRARRGLPCPSWTSCSTTYSKPRSRYVPTTPPADPQHLPAPLTKPAFTPTGHDGHIPVTRQPGSSRSRWGPGCRHSVSHGSSGRHPWRCSSRGCAAAPRAVCTALQVGGCEGCCFSCHTCTWGRNRHKAEQRMPTASSRRVHGMFRCYIFTWVRLVRCAQQPQQQLAAGAQHTQQLPCAVTVSVRPWQTCVTSSSEGGGASVAVHAAAGARRLVTSVIQHSKPHTCCW